jgi:hypothetical protein
VVLVALALPGAEPVHKEAKLLVHHQDRNEDHPLTYSNWRTKGKGDANCPKRGRRVGLEQSGGVKSWNRRHFSTVGAAVVAQTVATYLTVENDAMTTASGRIMSEYEQAMEWTNTRFRGGLATICDVQQAQTQLEATRAQAIDVGVLRAQYEHAVAVLIGTPPASFTLSPLPLTMRRRWFPLELHRNCSRGGRISPPQNAGSLRERTDWRR